MLRKDWECGQVGPWSEEDTVAYSDELQEVQPSLKEEVEEWRLKEWEQLLKWTELPP